MPRLHHLRSKLTILYAGLFCAALLLIGAIAYAVIAGNAQRQVREQLQATGVVFDRVWQLRFEQLSDGARLAARDYGFRDAVASRDDATIRSALANLRGRLGADLVFMVTTDGTMVGEAADASAPPGLQEALDQEDAPTGLLTSNGQLHQAVATPILAPNLIGWVVVGERLDSREMTALEQLAAIPLQAEVVARAEDGWRVVGRDRAMISAFIDRSIQTGAVDVLNQSDGPSVALVKPLHSLDGVHGGLLLRYPLARATAPYRDLFTSLFAVGAASLLLLVLGSWLIANGITKPLSSLAEAARKLQRGVYEPVAVNSEDELAHLAQSFNAMTEALRARERRIVQLAYHDVETRLPNRLALERRLGDAAPQRLYLAAVGIDRFAHVRAAIGYAHAETLVRHLGARLAKLIPNGLNARLSSDMLAVAYLADNEVDALQRANALIADLELPLLVDGQVVDLNITLGIAPPRHTSETPAAMIKHASIALDQARTARAKAAFFDKAAYGNPALNLSLMGEMRRALEDGAIFLAHQPKYDIRDNRIKAVETLVRWRHPTRGLIVPDLFVPMAEETGHVRVLTDWVLRQAIAEQKQLSSAGWPLSFAINLSGRLVGDEEFAQSAVEAARQALHPLCFEITETAVIDNPTVALKNIELFAQHGISISIDDYGSGLSSLAYLRQLPANELKIDRMFIENLTNNPRDALLVRSTIELAHGLGMSVTAEGVEHPATLALLASMGCDTVQGYLIARPAPRDDLIRILSDNARTANIQPVQRSATS